MSKQEKAQAEIEICRAYRALFLEEDGRIKPEAETVLRDMERKCGWMVDSLPVGNDGHVDPYRAAAALEKRGVYGHIKKRIFEPLNALMRATEM